MARIGEWINTSDKLPEVNTSCIGWMPDEENIDIVMRLHKGCWMAPAMVTQWMEIPPLNEWREMKQGRPKELGWYLVLRREYGVLFPQKEIWTGQDFISWDDIHVWRVDDIPIPYWMPLPEPPEEE